MQNEIPAGSKVKVAMTQKGVTTLHDAEVLAHMDGLVHVDVAGEVISVDASQIQMPDAPQEKKDAGTGAESGATGSADPTIPDLQSRVSALEARVSLLESDNLSIMAALGDLQTRVTALESKAAEPPPAPAQEIPNEQTSTAPVASAEPTAAVEVSTEATPEAAADAAGE